MSTCNLVMGSDSRFAVAVHGWEVKVPGGLTRCGAKHTPDHVGLVSLLPPTGNLSMSTSRFRAGDS